MYSEQCISVTDLRRKTGSYIGHDTYPEQFIFVGSKPTNVLMTMKRYEELRRIEDTLYERDLDLQFVPYSELSLGEQQRYDRVAELTNSSFIDF